MSTRATIPDQIKMLRQLHAEAIAEERFDVAGVLSDTTYLLRWIEANGTTIKLAHQAVSDKAVKAVQAAFPEATITKVTA